MTDIANLRTASDYINNQLLSRGLLRDGQSIDFADPSSGSGRDGGTAENMGRIISIVNDLILRRDRDAEHRESLATTLRTVRAEALRQANDLQRLQERHAEAQRKVNIGEAAEASLRAQLKASEANVLRLKDEAARTKVLVAQTRAACANEVRKRDRQIDGLKKAVAEAGRARGERKNPGVVSVTVTGDTGGCGGGQDEAGKGAPYGGTEDEGYDLRMETNAFLAELARGLSEENETLLALVRSTTKRLREMSGFSALESCVETGDGHAVTLNTNCEELAAEMEAILEHLRTILTNPSFVPIEEVVVREDEIHRLRDGWEKMEDRWREAVHLIDGWRRRMAVSGRPVNMEELKMGLRLSPVRVREVEETSQGLGLRLSTLPEEQEEDEEEEAAEIQSSPLVQHPREHHDEQQQSTPSPADSLHLVPAAAYDDADESDSESSSFEDDYNKVDLHELDVEEPNVQILEQSMMIADYSIDSPPMPPPPHLTPLRNSDSAGNRGGAAAGPTKNKGGGHHPQKKSGDFTTIIEENTSELQRAAAAAAAPAAPPVPPPHATKAVSARKPQKPTVFTERQQPAKVTARHVPREEVTRPTSAASQVSDVSSDSVLLVKSGAKKPSPTPRTATTGTASKRKPASTLSANTARQPTQSSAARTARTAASKTTTNSGSGGSVRGRRQPVRQRISRETSPIAPPKPAEGTAPAGKSSPSAPSDMPPPPLPVSKPATTTATEDPAPQPTPAAQRSRSRSPVKAPSSSSRLPLPRTGGNGSAASILPPPQQSPLSMATIAAKLAASEREADAARVRAKLKAARLLGKKRGPAGSSNGSSTSTAASSSRTVSGSTVASDISSVAMATAAGAASVDTDSVDPVKKTAPVPMPRSPARAMAMRSRGGRGEGGEDGEVDVEAEVDEEEDELALSQEDGISHPLRRHRPRLRGSGNSYEASGPEEDGDLQQLKPRKRGAPQKRRASKVASRRRSTLNPWELESLITGSVQVSSAGGGEGAAEGEER